MYKNKVKQRQINKNTASESATCIKSRAPLFLSTFFRLSAIEPYVRKVNACSCMYSHALACHSHCLMVVTEMHTKKCACDESHLERWIFVAVAMRLTARLKIGDDEMRNVLHRKCSMNTYIED